VAAATNLVSSPIVMFTAIENLVYASGTVVVASEIGGTAFASASAFYSSVMA
jgi:hypothetical protein